MTPLIHRKSYSNLHESDANVTPSILPKRYTEFHDFACQRKHFKLELSVHTSESFWISASVHKNVSLRIHIQGSKNYVCQEYWRKEAICAWAACPDGIGRSEGLLLWWWWWLSCAPETIIKIVEVHARSYNYTCEVHARIYDYIFCGARQKL